MLYADYIRKRMHHLFKVVSAAGYPITLLKSMGKSLKDYRIYGNTVQDSAAGTNIIKTASITLEGAEVDTSVTGDTALAVTEIYTLAFTTVGCTYTDNTLALFEVIYSDDTVVSVPPTESYKTLNEDGKTLTGIKCVNKCGCTGTVKNISCYTGRKPYEDNYSEISSVGDLNSDTGKYEIPITVRGKNLFSISRDLNHILTGSVIEFGTDYFIGIRNGYTTDVSPGSYNWSSGRVGFQNVTYGTATAADRFVKDLKPNTTYTFSCDVEVLEFAENVTRINPKCAISVSGKTVDGYAGYIAEVNKKYHIKNTFTTGDEIGTVSFILCLCSCKLKFSNPQLEEGSAESDFESYTEPINYTISLNEPLRSVNGKTDYLDFKNKKIIRNVFEKVVRGTDVTYESATFKNSYGWNSFEMDIPFGILYVRYEKLGLCTYFDSANTMNSHSLTKPYLIQRTGQAYQGIYFVTTPTSSQKLADFRVWVEEKYSSGYPLKVVWARTNPIEEDVDLPEISTLKGTVIIEVDSTIPPSNMEVKYISK